MKQIIIRSDGKEEVYDARSYIIFVQDGNEQIITDCNMEGNVMTVLAFLGAFAQAEDQLAKSIEEHASRSTDADH